MKALSSDLSDLGWFDAICVILQRDKGPTFGSACSLLGKPKQAPQRDRRGSLFLEPFDKRFSSIVINPDVDLSASSLPLDYLGFFGPSFALTLADVISRFPEYRLKVNTYDDGYQVFFYPVPRHFEFSAVSVRTRVEEIPDLKELIVNNVSFHFGDFLREYRDGFSMQRQPL